MADEIATSAQLLSDCAPDLIVFHCTDTSMTQGPQGEGRILDIVTDATGIDAVATSRLVLEALQTLGMKKRRAAHALSQQQGGDRLSDRHRASTVVHDVALKLEADELRQRDAGANGRELASENDRPDADGIFLSCTNTTQIEAIAEIERTLGKPVVNSNQAVLWGCVRRLRAQLAPLPPMPQLGRLMQQLELELQPAKRGSRSRRCDASERSRHLETRFAHLRMTAVHAGGEMTSCWSARPCVAVTRLAAARANLSDARRSP